MWQLYFEWPARHDSNTCFKQTFELEELFGPFSEMTEKLEPRDGLSGSLIRTLWIDASMVAQDCKIDSFAKVSIMRWPRSSNTS